MRFNLTSNCHLSPAFKCGAFGQVRRIVEFAMTVFIFSACISNCVPNVASRGKEDIVPIMVNGFPSHSLFKFHDDMECAYHNVQQNPNMKANGISLNFLNIKLKINAINNSIKDIYCD